MEAIVHPDGRLIWRGQTWRCAMPALSDYLEAALSELGFSLEDYLDSHLNSPVAPEVGPQTA